MHQSGVRMDKDHVCRPQDLYLWCSVGGSKNWGLWGCLMLFTSGCSCAIHISKSEHYLSLFRFFGDHNPTCRSRPHLTGRKSAPALGGFKSCYSSSGDSENVESGKSRTDFFSHSLAVQYRDPHFLLIAAQMETIVWICAQPPLPAAIGGAAQLALRNLAVAAAIPPERHYQ